VEEKYGLSRKQILDAFFAMRQAGEESEAESLLRVKEFRVKYKQAEDTCFRNFIPNLSLEYRRALKALSRSQGHADLTWAQVVSDANMCCEYSSLTPEDSAHTLTGFQRPAMEPLEEHVVAAAPPEARQRRHRSSSVHLAFASSEVEAAGQVAPPAP
jgi:hypothetical protein